MLYILEEEETDMPFPEIDLFISPPVNATGDQSDEDSGEDDGDVNINNLPGSILKAQAEIRGFQNEENYHGQENSNILPGEPEPGSSCSQHHKKKNYRKQKLHFNWKSEDLKPNWPEWIPSELVCNEKSPVEWFCSMFDDDVYWLLTSETNKYLARKNKVGDVTEEEMKCVIGVLLLSGYLTPARRRLFWENLDDTHNELVCSAISRDRFDFIFRHLHLNDLDKLDKQDKYTKVRPLIDLLNGKFKSMAPHSQNHSIDEAMVPYFGRHGCKQFIRNKPIRYGYKFWVGATENGYIIWFEPYQGASTPIQENYQKFGLGGSVILQYSDVLKTLYPEATYHFFFDNFFTNVPLLLELSSRKTMATGTIRENRTSNCPLEETSQMKKKGRGSFDYKTTEGKVTVCKWNDNSIVSIATNAVPIHPCKNVSRYSRQERKKIQIQQPRVISMYNRFMGGVDRSDQNISLYRVSMRGKKWYYPIIMHCIDMAEQNSWILHRFNNGKLDHLTFRRRIATALLETNRRTTKRGPSKPSRSEHMDSRYDRLDHLVIPQETQTRCRYCHQKSTTRCMKCDVGLHVKCFVPYHTKE